jgi:hypothetical protein
MELDDAELLEWIQQRANDTDAMRAARFRHGYERAWLTGEAAAGRVLRARAEVLGARIGTTIATLLLPALLLATNGGTPTEAGTLAAALTAGGAFALMWRGPSVLARVAVLQTIAVAVLVGRDHGIVVGLVAGVYLPPIVMTLATVCGAYAGTLIAADRHAKLRRQLARVLPELNRGEAEDAVAA